jgi:hypothetical protein
LWLICFVADTFWADTFCPDTFHPDTFCPCTTITSNPTVGVPNCQRPLMPEHKNWGCLKKTIWLSDVIDTTDSTSKSNISAVYATSL